MKTVPYFNIQYHSYGIIALLPIRNLKQLIFSTRITFIYKNRNWKLEYMIIETTKTEMKKRDIKDIQRDHQKDHHNTREMHIYL